MMKKCYVCGCEVKYEIKGKLYNGRVVGYCPSCWKSLQEGLKVWRLRQKLQEKD